MKTFVLSAIATLMIPLVASGVPLVAEVDLDIIHHLGDENLDGWGLFSLMPEPEGVTWTSGSFDLPSLEQGDAYLIIDVAQIDGTVDTAFWINDTNFNVLPTWVSADVWANDQSVAIDSALLLSEGNVIKIESGYDVGNSNYDDFLFRNVRIEYVPEPTSLSLLVLGSIPLLRRRRRSC